MFNIREVIKTLHTLIRIKVFISIGLIFIISVLILIILVEGDKLGKIRDELELTSKNYGETLVKKETLNEKNRILATEKYNLEKEKNKISKELESRNKTIAFIKVRDSRLYKINIILDYYKKVGQAQVHSYATSVALYQYLEWFEKYQPLIKRFNYDTFKPEDFFLLWGTNETHWNPKGYKENKCWDGTFTIDVGLMQINQVNWYLLPEVNKITGHKWSIDDLKTNPECSIALWCYWFGKHNQEGIWKIYGKFRKEVHDIYWKITGIKYE